MSWLEYAISCLYLNVHLLCLCLLNSITPPTLEKQLVNGRESGTVRLLRTCSKAFSCGGDEKSGVYGHFLDFCKDYLKDNRMKSIPIERFRGNRFNMLFSNAANVFFLHTEIEKYLSYDSSGCWSQSIMT